MLEQIAKEGKKAVAVKCSLSNKVNPGSVDSDRELEDYVGSDYDLVIGEWRELKKCGAEACCGVVEEWGKRLKRLLDDSDQCTGFIVLSGEAAKQNVAEADGGNQNSTVGFFLFP